VPVSSNAECGRRNDGADSENDPPESENPEVQYVWSAPYIDAPVLRDRDAGAGGDLGVTDSGLEERLYYTTDANMNVTALLDTGGDAVERYLYDPYGQVEVLDADFSADADGKSDYANAILFCGYYHDWETGLYHVRYRVLHPRIGHTSSAGPRSSGREPTSWPHGPAVRPCASEGRHSRHPRSGSTWRRSARRCGGSTATIS